MIEKLLEYQKLDRDRLELLRRVEGGKVRAEINAANRIVNEARAGLLALEEDAKNLGLKYDETSTMLKRIMLEVKNLEAMKIPTQDGEIQSTTENVSTILQRANSVCAELERIAKQIGQKTKAFEESKTAVVRAQATIKSLTPQYTAQQNAIKPQMETFERDMAKHASGIDKTLLEKYKNRRKAEVGGKVVDIVVPVVAGRCGGCNFEMSNLQSHKIATDGYVVCEECGKILYKGK